MSTLKKDHVIGTGGSAVAGGTIGAAIGGVIAGPPGLALGAAAGTAIGAVAGHRMSDAIDRSGDVGHFEDVFMSMPYYIAEMKWSDYAPAYHYGVQTYPEYHQRGLEGAETELEAGWPRAKGKSRLLWSEARDAVAHAWRSLDETIAKEG